MKLKLLNTRRVWKNTKPWLVEEEEQKEIKKIRKEKQSKLNVYKNKLLL